ncbi:MAG: Hsp70 family protein, partial [Thiomargarita sp.]|nr:Hsp70 family protein [Thiomargarita sp.]
MYAWKLSLNDVLIERVKACTGYTEKDIENQNIPDEIVQSVANETGFTVEAIKHSNIAIKNVASKSFGVVARNENNQDEVVNLVLKNTRVPIEVRQKFGTHLNNQKTAKIRVMEDEVLESKINAEDAVEIGTAILKMPDNLPANSPIEIIFRLNEEGRLNITAIETTKSREVTVTIETTAVMQGDELEEAKTRAQKISVS